ncbi:hypothetical protein Bca4012_071615 [Brassica carinata]
MSLSGTELLYPSRIVSQVASATNRIWQLVVLSGLTLLSEKRHPMMVFSHMDVALWIVCYHCSSLPPLQFVSKFLNFYLLLLQSSVIEVCVLL